MKKIIISAMGAMLAFSSVAMASYDNLSVEYDNATKNILISGEIPNLTRNEAVKVVILTKDAKTIDEMTLMSVDEKFTKDHKYFSFTEKLPGYATDELYDVIIQSKTGGKEKVNLTVLTDEKMIEKLNELNGADVSEILTWISENEVSFDLSKLFVIDIYKELSPDMREYVAAGLESVDFSASNITEALEKKKLLQDSFLGCTLSAYAKTSEGDTERFVEFLDTYSNYIGAEEYINNAFVNVNDKNKVIGKILSDDFKNLEEFKEAYTDNVILGVVSETIHWTEVAEVIESEKVYLGLDQSIDNIKKQNRYLVYSKLIGEEFSSIEKLKNAYSDAIKEVISELSKQNEKKSGGGGGGNRNSGSSPATNGIPQDIVVYQPSVHKKTEEDVREAELFDDAKEVPWAREQINRLANQKIISGYGDGKFGVFDNVTRGQFTKILTNALGITPSEEKEMSFNDVSRDDIFREEISACYSAGIINGQSENKFGINEPITREDACVILDRALKFIEYKPEGGSASDFSDVGEISEYAKEAVAVLSGEGLIQGSDGLFRPKNNITRAETAVIIVRVLDKLFK
ncbi:MAG: S-layer homology domain-containing protein [Clostridia bacterium]|nr:S-layer homology domain-containing protein [Clostridia bacterium]